jgi:hypothetical protein
MVAMRVADQDMIQVVWGVAILAEGIHDLRRAIQQYPRATINQDTRGTSTVGTEGIASPEQHKFH